MHPHLIEEANKIVVIDHHRRAEDSVENPTLSYIESYASSTSELISEILQYAAPKKTLIKLEAEALLGGITIDTLHDYAVTGVDFVSVGALTHSVKSLDMSFKAMR